MGQSHPTGPNVVGIRETGGGKDCDCGPPRFEASYFDPRLASAGIQESEFHTKIQDVNERMKKVHTPCCVITGIIVGLCVVPNLVGSILIASDRKPREREGGASGFMCSAGRRCEVGETAEGAGCCRLWCCERDRYGRLPSPLEDPWEAMKSRPMGSEMSFPYNFPDVDSVCTATFERQEYVAELVLTSYVEPECCVDGERTGEDAMYLEGNFTVRWIEAEEPGAATVIGFLLMFILPVGGVVGLLVFLCNMRSKREAVIHQSFADWGSRGVGIHYIRPTKHTNGALYFITPQGTGAVPMVPIAAVAAAAPVLMQVTVPAGVAPGGLILVQAPDGRQVQVQVPAGVMAGKTIQVQV